MLSLSLSLTLLATPAAPLQDWALLDAASRRAFNFFVERSHPVTGYTKDRSNNFTALDSGDHFVASVAAIGFALSAYAVGEHRRWITREKALDLSRKTLRHMYYKAPQSHGWYYHWLNWETGKIEWNSEVSTIDSAILWSGMLLNERALKDKEITKLTNLILKRIDWKYMQNNGGEKPEKKTFTMGYRDGKFLDAEWAELSENHMLYLLAMGAEPSFKADLWSAFQRKWEEGFGKKVLSGGPLFMHQMSHVFFDFKGRRDALGYDYWSNSRLMTLLQREYGRQHPEQGYSHNIWGFSACDIPDGYGAQGFPGGYLGDKFDNGTLAPPAAIASMMFTPRESMASANAYMKQFPETWGIYGFSGGINPGKKWHAQDVIGIDIGQMMLGIENARDGFPNRVFMSHPIAKRGMEKAGFKVTKEGPVEKRAIHLAP